MNSSVLVYNFHKSLYQRLFYALVDGEYITKALNDGEIKELLKDIERDARLIRKLKNYKEGFAFRFI